MQKTLNLLISLGLVLSACIGLSFETLYDPTFVCSTEEVETSENSEKELSSFCYTPLFSDGGDGDEEEILDAPAKIPFVPVALLFQCPISHLVALYQSRHTVPSRSFSDFPLGFSRPSLFILYHSWQGYLA